MFISCGYNSMIECDEEIYQSCDNCDVFRSLNKKDTDINRKRKKGYKDKILTTTDFVIILVIWILIALTISSRFVVCVY